ALFEEYTIWLICSEYLAKFRRNHESLLMLTRMSIRPVDCNAIYRCLTTTFSTHFAMVQRVDRFNRVKVSKSILAFICSMLPLNVYLISSLMFFSEAAIWTNLYVTVLIQTI